MKGMNAKGISALEEARAHVKEACDRLGEPAAVYEILSKTQRLVQTRLPVRMDDGSIQVFSAYRALHSNILGPGKGGIRFHPQVNAEEVEALALWMSLKCALAGLPYGGGKGGVAVDVQQHSPAELERIARAYVDAMFPVLGDLVDIPAPDVHTNGTIMAWMLDEYQKLSQQSSFAAFTGKPVAFGGSLGRNDATGLGVAIAVQSWSRSKQRSMKDLRCAVQGFGNVGSLAVKHLIAMGARVVAVAHHVQGREYAIYNEEGLDYASLAAWYDNPAHRHFLEYPHAQVLPIEDFWSLPVEVLAPCALENAVTAEVATSIRAKLVIEGANGPVTAAAEKELLRRSVDILPDIFANAGGVIVSYYEWVQNRSGEHWTQERVFAQLRAQMEQSYEALSEVAKEFCVDYRSAAYLLAIRRLAEGLRWRGQL